MGFEKLIGIPNQEGDSLTTEKVEELERSIREVITLINNKAEEAQVEFQKLTAEQQNEVQQKVLEFLNKKHGHSVLEIIRGSVAAGFGGMAISGIAGSTRAGLIGGGVAIFAALAIPLIDKYEELKARRFFD